MHRTIRTYDSYLKNIEFTKAFERQGSKGNAAIRLPNAVNCSSLSNAPRSCNSVTALSTFSKLGGFRSLDSITLALSWLCIYIILSKILYLMYFLCT